MTLENLLKINQLETHATNADQLSRLLNAASRGLTHARQSYITNETRLDAAYRSITQLCTAALWANGYRTSKSRPGHHQTMIQSLVHTLGMDSDRVRLIDTFRVKRNAIDYTGAEIDDNSVAACIAAAEKLQIDFLAWLNDNRPDLTH